MDRWRALLGALLLAASASAVAASREAPDPSPHAIEIPGWFRETFLHIPEDVREAAAEGRRLLIYFGQDGCPYCRELMRVNFGQKHIVERTQRHFHAVAINIWGDREVTWTDGKARTEKALAAFLKVQFTPTLLFLDEKGAVALRLNGYYPPHRFETALEFAAPGPAREASFADYLRRRARAPASGVLHAQPYFLEPPYDLARARRAARKPLLVLFEQKQCGACDSLHAQGLRDAAVRKLLDRFVVVRLELFGAAPVTTPQGKQLTEEQWGRALGLSYTPSLVFFDAAGREALRMEAYLKPFHIASGLEYVAGGAYRSEPSFQRFIQERAKRIRAAGGRVELW
jgi:thioredoxin-related protein